MSAVSTFPWFLLTLSILETPNHQASTFFKLTPLKVLTHCMDDPLPKYLAEFRRRCKVCYLLLVIIKFHQVVCMYLFKQQKKGGFLHIPINQVFNTSFMFLHIVVFCFVLFFIQWIIHFVQIMKIAQNIRITY